MLKEKIHNAIVQNRTQLENWFMGKNHDLIYPIYASFDIRDSGYKIAPVDANVFPAGFNNICHQDQDAGVELAQGYLDTHYPEAQIIGLVTEEHTQNPYYWENVFSLYNLINKTGREVLIAFPRDEEEPSFNVSSINGHDLKIHSALNRGGCVFVDGKKVDLILSNNDFSYAYESWAEGLKTPINPPHALGWHKRKKESFFKIYNQLAGEFAEVLGIQPWSIQVATAPFRDFDVSNIEIKRSLSEKVDEMVTNLKQQYQQFGISENPFIYVKNNSGTYGMGVTKVISGQDILEWNNRTRTKMKASKGGRGISELIIQEGIPSVIKTDEITAEPVIYMLGCQLLGGFLRAHNKKGESENLNSPGAVYKRLCVNDLQVSVQGHPMENVYGWLAKLGILAIAMEAKEIGVKYVGYCDK